MLAGSEHHGGERPSLTSGLRWRCLAAAATTHRHRLLPSSLSQALCVCPTPPTPIARINRLALSRCLAMDYAAIAGDPSGASPWGSSSPRTDTFSATPDLPSTDQEQSHGDSVDGGERESAASPELPPTAAAEGWEDQASPLHPDQQQQQQKQQEEPQPDDLQEPEQQQQEQQNPSPVVSPPPQLSPGQSRSPLPARYQNAARQQAARQTPQYRLQAKVTGLERIGKKDPILRFDVHVCFRCCDLRWRLTRTDKHSPVSHQPDPRHQAHALGIRQVRRLPHLVKS